MDTHFDNSRFSVWKDQVLRIAIIFLFGVVFISFCQAQQYPVTITIAVSPPYPPKISECIAQPNKIMATLVNTSVQVSQVYIQGSITGEGGIKVYTDPNYKMPQPLVLQPGMPFQLNQGNIQQVFSSDHLVFQGIKKNEILYGSGLPEGNYTICLQVFDYNTNQQLSPLSPQGCSNTFMVTGLEVPIILQPVCGDNLKPATPQNIIFSWTRPPGAPANMQFNLKIIEVLPTDRNINDAMQSASHPVFFEKTVPMTSCIFGPSDPQLVNGKKYAFAVTAIDPAGQATFRNKGMSEVCSFSYGETGPNITLSKIQLISPHKGDTIKDYPLFQWMPPGNNNPQIINGNTVTNSYRLRVCEVLTGQNRDTAIKNSPHVLKDLMTNSFRCPPDAVEPGKSYCWQVCSILDGKTIATSEVWDFYLPYFFSPVMNLIEKTVHIEKDPAKDNTWKVWVVEILLPDGSTITVGFIEDPGLKQCDYIVIKEITVKTNDKTKEILKIIKKWEKIDAAIAKKTWAKDALARAEALGTAAGTDLDASLKGEESVVNNERKASSDLGKIISDKIFPGAGGFNKNVTDSKDLVDFALDDETNDKTGAKKAKEDVKKDLPGITDEIKKIKGNIDKAVVLEKDNKNDFDVLVGIYSALGELFAKIGKDIEKLKHAKDKEETALGEKEIAIESIDGALAGYKDVDPRSSEWKTLLNNAKSEISSSIPDLKSSIEHKKSAIKEFGELKDEISKAMGFINDALDEEANKKK